MRWLFVALVTCMLALAACQVFVNLADEPGVDRPDAEVDAAPPRPSLFPDAAGDPCVHVDPPPPPANPSDAGAAHNGEPLYFVARAYTVIPESQTPPGFDLDGRCTGAKSSTTSQSGCIRASNAPADIDFPGGLDNAFSEVIKGTPVAGDFAGTLLSNNAAAGLFSILVQVQGYNGLPNDDDVNVSFASAGAPTCAGDAGPCPSFVPGADTWKYFPGNTQLVAGTTNVIADAKKGYVSNGTLVVDGGEETSIALSGGAAILLKRMRMTGSLTPKDGSYELKTVVIGGTVPANDVLGFVHGIDVDDEPLCRKPPAVARIFIDNICENRDLPSEPFADLPCDAISFGFQFDAVLVKLDGPTKDREPSCIGIARPSCD